MATNLTGSSAYAGEVLDALEVKLSLGFPTAESGLFFPHVNIKRNQNPAFFNQGPGAYIPRMAASNLIQAYQPEPSSQGSFAYDEKPIEMGNFMVYTEFNPRDFEDLWRPFQPNGDLMFRELPGDVQAAMTEEVLRHVMPFLEKHFWQGDDTATAGAGIPTYWKGIIPRLLGSSATGGSITGDSEHNGQTAGGALTSANIVQELETAIKAWMQTSDEALAAWRNPDFKFCLSPVDYQKLREADYEQTSKGRNFTEQGIQSFQGRPVVECDGVPENIVIGGVFNATRAGELHYAVDLDMTSSQNTLFEKKNNYSDLYFVKLVAKAGANYRWGSQIFSLST